MVLLRVAVSAAGEPERVALEQSSGHALLDDSALAAVRRWRFEPARLGPVAVASQVQVPVRFRLAE